MISQNLYQQQPIHCPAMEAPINGLTFAERAIINRKIVELNRQAESGERFSDVCHLVTLLAGGPWFNGVTQEQQIAAWRSENA